MSLVSDSIKVNAPIAADSFLIKNKIFNQLYDSLSTNPYFSAGAGLIGIGAVATLSKRAFIIASTVFRRRFISVLEVDNTDRFLLKNFLIIN